MYLQKRKCPWLKEVGRAMSPWLDIVDAVPGSTQTPSISVDRRIE